jgi:hypothetical protein
MSGGDTSPGGADIEGFGKFNELNTGSVHPSKKNRYLEADTW